MGFSPNGFTAGPVLTSEWEAEFTLVRDWLNTGIVVGDITDNTLDYTHIYRPDTFGFPKRSTESETQGLYDGTYAVNAPAVEVPQSAVGNSLETLGLIRQRVSLFPDYVDAHASVWPTARRVVLDTTADVDVTCSWMAVVRMDHGSSPSLHPNSAGNFVIQYTNESSGTRTAVAHSRRRLTCGITLDSHGISVGNHSYSTCASIEDLAAGVYDFALDYEYDPASDKTDVYQVIIVPVSIVIEVHKS